MSRSLVAGLAFGAWCAAGVGLAAQARDTATVTGVGRPLTIMLDPDFGMRSGAETAITLNRGVSSLVDRAIGRQWFDETTPVRKVGGVLARLARYTTIDLPTSYFTAVLAHEWLGHGGRYRELDIDDVDYGFDWPPPYGAGGGHAAVELEGGATEHDILAMWSGGLESQAIIQKRLGLRWMTRNELDFADALLFWWSFQIQMDYLLGSEDFAADPDDNDPRAYVRWLNISAGYSQESEFIWTLDDLKDRYVLNALNPFVAFAVFAQLEALWNGGAPRKVPSLSLGEVAYLPALRTGLTPFGPEVHLENYLRVGQRAILLDLSKGDGTFYDSWGGGGLTVANLLEEPSFALDVDVRIWRQPDLLTLGQPSDREARSLGAAASVRGHYEVDGPNAVFLTTELGYKSRGFVEGYRMDSGPILLLGLGLGR